MSGVWLETDHPDDMKKGLVNELKGQALESLLRYATGRSFESKLGTVLDDLDESDLKEYYRATKMFKLRSSDGKYEQLFRKTSGKGIADVRFSFEPSRLPDDKEFKLLESTAKQETYLGYKKCPSVNGEVYPPVYCERCGGGAITDHNKLITEMISKAHERQSSDSGDTITVVTKEDVSDQFLKKVRDIKNSVWNDVVTEGLEWCVCERQGKDPVRREHLHTRQNHSKCRNCHEKYYNKMTTEFSHNMKVVEDGLNAEELKNVLHDQGFITEVTMNSLSRLDLWTVDDELYVTEAKNHEKSGLSYGAIVQVCGYLQALGQRTDKAKDATIVYNGRKNGKIDRATEVFNDDYGLNIKTQHLRDWCKDQGFYFEEIVVGKEDAVPGHDMRNSRSGEYFSKVVESDSLVDTPTVRLKSQPKPHEMIPIDRKLSLRDLWGIDPSETDGGA
jgi:ribosomal protein S17E